MTLPAGKVPPNVLRDIVFSYLGAQRKEIAVGPALGLDGAVVDIGDQSLVTSMDPITGALERVGWLAVNVNANDVATFGVPPAFFSSCLLLPEDATPRVVQTICQQIDVGAKNLGMAVTGGHSETTPNLSFPIVVGCCMGLTAQNHYVTAQRAQAGNRLILTKSVGLEGTAILATDRRDTLVDKMGSSIVKRAEAFFDRISVVPEALLAFRTGHVTAMHDPTEGGVAGGLHELADASNVGLQVYEDRIRITEETAKICGHFDIDPLQLIASGSLLIAVEHDHADNVVNLLEQSGTAAAVIGDLVPTPDTRLIQRRDGTTEELVRPIADHLWKALETR